MQYALSPYSMRITEIMRIVCVLRAYGTTEDDQTRNRSEPTSRCDCTTISAKRIPLFRSRKEGNYLEMGKFLRLSLNTNQSEGSQWVSLTKRIISRAKTLRLLPLRYMARRFQRSSGTSSE